jgi:hypothetical protein
MVDTICDVAQLTAGATFDIRPTGTGQWIVHNVYVKSGKQVRVDLTNGAYTINVDTITGSLLCFCFHLTNIYYMKLTNLSGETIQVGYDGIAVV